MSGDRLKAEHGGAYLHLRELRNQLRSRGEDRKTVLTNLRQANDALADPLPIARLKELAQGEIDPEYVERRNGKGAKMPGASGGRVASGDFVKLRRLDVAHMLDTVPPEPDFLITPIAARGECTLLWGPPGVGKSMLLQACAAAMGRGEPVAGLSCKPGRVLYLDAENGVYEIHRRVRNLNLPADSVAIYEASASVHLIDDEDEIRAAIRQEQPDLVIVDSLRRLTPGSQENDSGEMAETIAAAKQLAQEFNIAVLVIHHAKKDGKDYRGSAAIRDQVSISWQMGRADGDADRSKRRLRCEKMRIAAEPADIWLHIVFDQDGSVAVLEGEATGPGAQLTRGTKRNDLADEILEALTGGPLQRPAIARAVGREPKDGTLRRALDDLNDAGIVEKDGKLWQLAHVPDEEPES